MRRAVIAILLASVAGPALAEGGPTLAEGGPGREWPSSRFRGAPHVLPPCTCRGPGAVAEVGQDICLATPDGQRRARCVMVQNNTSWSVSQESCGATALLMRSAVPTR